MCLAQWLRLRRELPAIHRRYSMKKSVLKNFAIFTGKHLSRSLFNKVEGLKAKDHLFWKTSANGCFWESTISSYHPVPSGKVFPQVSHLPPSKQSNFHPRPCMPEDTSATSLVLIFLSILNLRQTNQKREFNNQGMKVC